MKIIKAYKSEGKIGHLYLMVDYIPKITYRSEGASYVGSDEEDYFNDYLKYEYAYGNMLAFAGREINIVLKDGSVKTLKDHWWASGIFDKEHEYISIGLGTLESLQECFVFCSYNIRKDKIENLLEEYLKDNPFYDYWEIKKWSQLQYEWYPLIFHGRVLPFLMNYKGDIIDNIDKKPKYALNNYLKFKNEQMFRLTLFKLSYMENGRLIKLEDKYDNVVKETLSEEAFNKYKNYCKNK